MLDVLPLVRVRELPVARELTGDAIMCRCRICNEVDVLTHEMRDWEALPTQSPSWVAPCMCSSVTHRSCLEARASDAAKATGAPAAVSLGAASTTLAADAGARGHVHACNFNMHVALRHWPVFYESRLIIDNTQKQQRRMAPYTTNSTCSLDCPAPHLTQQIM
jgi:hypothetical protein